MTQVTKKGLLGGFLLLAVLAGPLCAAEERAVPQVYGVFVGISHYPDRNIKPRPHAEDDARALYTLFTGQQHLGVPKSHMRLLLGNTADPKGDCQPATRDNIIKAIGWLASQARRDDLVLLAFMGQAAVLGERGDRVCYLASDSTVKDLQKTSLLASTLGEEMDKVKSLHSCTFLDIYFKGYTPTGGGAPPEPALGPLAFREFLGHENGSEEVTIAPGHVLYLASAGRYPSPDADKHGSFTQVLLDGLKGKADKEGYEPDGVITVDELTEYLNKEFPALVRKLGSPDKDRSRLNLVLAGEDTHFILSRNPEVTATVDKRRDKFTELAKNNKKITPEMAAEGQDYLQQMPRLAAQRTLRKVYQALADGKLTVEKFLENRENILEGAKLRRAVALDFAEKVLDATKMVARDYVKQVNKGEMVGWAIRGLYRKVEEKIPEDVAKKMANLKDLKEKELLNLLANARMHLGQREDLDKHKDIDVALQRMLSKLDPYTTFYDPESLDREKSQIQGRFTGVGIQIRKDSNTDMLQVITPIVGSPAFKAGIQAGDIITAVIREVDNQGKPLKPAEVISTKGMDITEAVRKIQGKPDTRVKLTIQRPGEDKPREYNLIRKQVQVETVLGSKRHTDSTWDYLIDPGNKIAYVRLTQFTRNSFPDMFKVMADLKKKGIKGLVLDLRFNPGGLLDSARDISDLFIDDGLIVSIRPRVGGEYVMAGRHEGSFLNFPMVCLVNGLSASGSEIVAACLQDHHRALIVGERSYGKGSVQNVLDFEKEGRDVKSQIKLTTASFWRPSGKNLNKASTGGKDNDEWGVVPDRLVPLTRAERDDLFEHLRNQEIIQPAGKPVAPETRAQFKDKQLDAALTYLQNQIKLVQLGTVKKAG